MVFSPPCRIPRPRRLYKAQHCDWWSSEWRKGGGQLSGPPGWRWSPSGNMHTQMCKSLSIISCLPTTWLAMRGNIFRWIYIDHMWIPSQQLVLFHNVSFHWHTILQTLSNTAPFIFNQHFLLSSLQFHFLLLVGKLLELQVQQKGKTFAQYRQLSLYWIQAFIVRTTEGTALCTNYESPSPHH